MLDAGLCEADIQEDFEHFRRGHETVQ
jgi:hypothetical protein